MLALLLLVLLKTAQVPMPLPQVAACENRLDARLLKRPPYLCRRLQQEDCKHFFVFVEPARRRINSSIDLTPGSREPFSKPCMWGRGGCSAGPRAICHTPIQSTNPDRRSLLKDAALDQTLDLTPRVADASMGKAVWEAIDQAAKLRRRREKLLRKASTQHLGQPCTSRSESDKGVADCESWYVSQ